MLEAQELAECVGDDVHKEANGGAIDQEVVLGHVELACSRSK
jgi:hypothetical protein